MRTPVQVFASGLAVTLYVVAPHARAESYTVFDAPDGSTPAIGSDINAHGAVAGFGAQSFVRFADGTEVVIDPKHSPYREADRIDGKGWVAGHYQRADGHYDAFLRKPNGKIITIPAPPGWNLSVSGLNNFGDICGYAAEVGAPANYYGFLRTVDGAFVALKFAGSTEAVCTGINDSGTTTGWWADQTGHHGFLRAADGSITDIGGTPMDINAAGDVAGTANLYTAFVRNAAGEIRTFSGPNSDLAFPGMFVTVRINANGTVAGTYLEMAGHNAEYHGFIAPPGGAVSLFDPPGIPGNTIALGLNDKGEITGTFVGNDDVEHGFIRKP